MKWELGQLGPPFLKFFIHPRKKKKLGQNDVKLDLSIGSIFSFTLVFFPLLICFEHKT